MNWLAWQKNSRKASIANMHQVRLDRVMSRITLIAVCERGLQRFVE